MSVSHSARAKKADDPAPGSPLSQVLDLDPFPHVYAPTYMDVQTCTALTSHWPPESTMAPEPPLERSFAHLVFNDEVRTGALPADMQEFWTEMLAGPLHQLLQDVAQAFAPLIAAKFPTAPKTVNLQIHRLMCLQAEEGFIEHEPHSHSAAPNWVFTFLLYLDDEGRSDRGTTLYRVAGLDFESEINAIWTDSIEKDRIVEAKRSAFQQGALLAFYDTPISLHGSTRFDEGQRAYGRRLVRGHISLGPDEVEAVYQSPPDELNAQLAKAITEHRESEADKFDQLARFERDIAITRAFVNGEVPDCGRMPAFRFPALENLRT